MDFLGFYAHFGVFFTALIPDGYPSGIRAVKNHPKMGIKAQKIHQNFLPSYFSEIFPDPPPLKFLGVKKPPQNAQKSTNFFGTPTTNTRRVPDQIPEPELLILSV